MKLFAVLVVVAVLSGCPGPSSADGGSDGGGGGGDGAYDSGFTPVLPGVQGQGYAVVPSGSNVFVVGNGSSDGGAASLLVARFRPDRSLDPTWAGTGFTLVDALDSTPLLSSDTGYAALVDGASLYVCGTAQSVVVPGAGPKVMLAKFLGDGSLDTTFGNTGAPNGVRLDSFGMSTTAACTALAKQPDGKILIGGDVQGNFFVTRYLPSGTADVSFSKTPGTGFGAVWGTSRDEVTRAMVLDPDGKIVVFGGNSMSAARLLPDGQLDLSFGTAGYFSSPGAEGVALWRESDGSYLAVGHAPLHSDAGVDQLAVRFLKISSGGIADLNFGLNGYRQVVLPGSDIGLSTVRGVGRLADGGFVLYLTGLGTTYLARFNADFTLDAAGLVPTSIKLPLLQPSFNVAAHLTVTEGNRVWVTDINLVTVEPRGPTQKNFFEVITKTF